MKNTVKGAVWSCLLVTQWRIVFHKRDYVWRFKINYLKTEERRRKVVIGGGGEEEDDDDDDDEKKKKKKKTVWMHQKSVHLLQGIKKLFHLEGSNSVSPLPPSSFW